MTNLAALGNMKLPAPQSGPVVKSEPNRFESDRANQSKSSARDFNEELKDFDKHPEKTEVRQSKNNSVEKRDPLSPDPKKYESSSRVEDVAFQQEGTVPLNRQEAMWAFLDRMESELGVQPSEVLDAFAKMDVDLLMAPPEESADEFVQNLKVAPQDQEKALSLYSQLLTWTSAAGLSTQLQNHGQSAQLKVLNPEQFQKQQRMEGLNDLSDRFFMNGSHNRENLLQARENVQSINNQLGLGDRPGANLADRIMAQKLPNEGAIPSDQNAMKTASTEELVRSLQQEVAQKSAAEASAMNQLSLQQKMQALKTYAQPNGDMNTITQQTVAPELLDVPELKMQNITTLNSSMKPMDPMMAQAQGGEAEMDMNSDPQFAEANVKSPTGKANGAEFIVKAPQPTEVEMSENIREIINKAQVMVKDGGGEMKVSLRPEGMGNVNLKVNVDGGNVNVEMLTASDETRKLLEKGLGDLKETLSLQKLNVENIKVESAQDAAEKLMQERQEAAERHFQERFLRDFTGENSARRSMAFGVEPVNRPGSQTEEDADNTVKRKNSDRRLDLVA